MPTIDRSWLTPLADDSGTGTDGSIVDKALLTDIADAVDGGLAAVPDTTGITSNGTKITAVAFPATQSASADANTLDDYEEGSWTPVIGGSGGTSGQTYAIQVGRYIKVGKQVHAQCYVVLTAKGTITTNVEIQGLPFASENTSNNWALANVWWAALSTNWMNLCGTMAPNTQVISVVGNSAAAASSNTNLAAADISNTTQFMVSISYRAAS